MSRYIHIGSRITGWHAVKSRVEQLQLEMTEAQIKDVTAKIKELADVKTQSMEDVDSVLRIYHRAVSTGEIAVGQRQVRKLIYKTCALQCKPLSHRSPFFLYRHSTRS